SSTVQNTRILFDMERFAMRQEPSISRAQAKKSAVVALAVVALSVPAFGQTGQLGSAAAVQGATAQPAGTVRLSSDDAVKLAIEQKGREIADVDLHSAMVQTARLAKNAYWDLVYRIDNLRATRQSLELAQQSLKDNTRRVEIGTMAPIDIVDAKAEVARNEEAVIVAQAQIEQAQDTLKTLVFDPSTPNFWNIRVEPAETVPFQAQTI